MTAEESVAGYADSLGQNKPVIAFLRNELVSVLARPVTISAGLDRSIGQSRYNRANAEITSVQSTNLDQLLKHGRREYRRERNAIAQRPMGLRTQCDLQPCSCTINELPPGPLPTARLTNLNAGTSANLIVR